MLYKNESKIMHFVGFSPFFISFSANHTHAIHPLYINLNSASLLDISMISSHFSSMVNPF